MLDEREHIHIYQVIHHQSARANFGYENYLSIIKNFEQRRRLSKLRISAHKLQIEIGRYQGTPNM
jgi:hypothetical protein